MSDTAKQPIAVVTDFKPRSDRAMDRAIKLAKQQGRELVVIHAMDDRLDSEEDRDRILKKIASVMPSQDIAFRAVLPLGAPPTAIAQAAADEDPFMLVMSVARYNSVGDYFLGTAVDYVLRKCICPVLVVKERPHHDYDNIVIGTDFSKYAQVAFEAVAEMFPDASIHAVHAFHVPYEGWQQAAYVKQELADTANTKLGEFKAGLAVPEDCRGRMTTGLVEGTPIKAMNRAIAKADAHLCVLASHGQGGIRQALIGSTVSELLRSIQVDTLVINASRKAQKARAG